MSKGLAESYSVILEPKNAPKWLFNWKENSFATSPPRLDFGDAVASVAITPIVSTDRSAPESLRRLSRPKLETLIQKSPPARSVVVRHLLE